MSGALTTLDEPTADGLPAEIPEAPGMGPTAPDAGYGAVGPGLGASPCRCTHTRDDHRPRGGACLEDDCPCDAFGVERREGRPRLSRAVSAARHEAWLAAYVYEGLSASAVGKRFGVSHEAVCYVMRKAGVIRGRGAPRARGAS